MQLYLSALFFFNDTATTEIYTLSLHDALPISWDFVTVQVPAEMRKITWPTWEELKKATGVIIVFVSSSHRSEEHTSELQSHLNLVCRLLLEKKNKNA